VRIFVPIKQRPIRGKAYRNLARPEVFPFKQEEKPTMGRYLLLWLLGIPIPILVLIWLFGGLH
jgi:hypothetical protein